MEQSELLRYVTETLERIGLRYFVTGSMATIFFGEPRFTNDIDIVVDLPVSKIPEFCSAFPAPEYYLSEETVRRAVSRRGQFNIIRPSSGLKVDIMVPADSPFNRSRFARATRVKPQPDVDAIFSSAEDVIVKKLEAYREGGSEKHLRDIAGVLRISGSHLDRAYISEWAERLGVTDIWRQVLRRTGEA
ncbi:MAG TPA: hypothetical protein VGX68_16840 [Thermoanaerobaculia bacterium]|jgi:hypothetical protein|nr:hypothetical protein [Thermoanaerobaculia bacterium]